ncbi:unnamed protein product, partial [marine sediment metagenome]
PLLDDGPDVGGTAVDGHVHDASDVTGTFLDNVEYGDVRSYNWDGGSDLSAVDPVATGGYLWDASEGAFQSSSRGYFGVAARYLQLGIHPVTGRLTFIFEDDNVVGPGIMAVGAEGGAAQSYLSWEPPYRAGAGFGRTQMALLDYSPTEGDGTDVAVWSVWDVNVGTYSLWYTADNCLVLGDDPNTYLKWEGADNWGIYMGGTKILDLTATGPDIPAGDLSIGGVGLNDVIGDGTEGATL